MADQGAIARSRGLKVPYVFIGPLSTAQSRSWGVDSINLNKGLPVWNADQFSYLTPKTDGKLECQVSEGGVALALAMVRLYHRLTGVLIAQQRSDASGYVKFLNLDTTDKAGYYLTALDPDGGSTYNAIVFDRLSAAPNGPTMVAPTQVYGTTFGTPYLQKTVVTDPAEFFAGGYDGFYVDLSNSANLFSDVARTIPATLNGDVRGITDLSGKERHLTTAQAGFLRKAEGVYFPGNLVDTFASPALAVGSSDGQTLVVAYRTEGGNGQPTYNGQVLIGEDYTPASNIIFQTYGGLTTGVPRGFGISVWNEGGGSPYSAYTPELIAKDGDYLVSVQVNAADTFVRLDQVERVRVPSVHAPKSRVMPVCLGSTYGFTTNPRYAPLKGRIYAAFLINRVLRAEELAALEVYLKSKMPAPRAVTLTTPLMRSSTYNVNNVSSTSHAWVMPPGIAVGDLILVAVSVSGNIGVSVPPAGFQRLVAQNYSASGSVGTSAWYWKIADGTESGLSLAASMASSTTSVVYTQALQAGTFDPSVPPSVSGYIGANALNFSVDELALPWSCDHGMVFTMASSGYSTVGYAAVPHPNGTNPLVTPSPRNTVSFCRWGELTGGGPYGPVSMTGSTPYEYAMLSVVVRGAT